MDSPATASATGESPNEKPAGEPGEPVIRTSRHAGLRDSVLGTRNLMTVAALGVVGAIMVVPLTYLSLIVAVNPNGILIMCALMGAWIIPYLLPGVIVNKPGVFIISGFVMGVIAAFLTPQGPSAILGNVIGSLLVGAPVDGLEPGADLQRGKIGGDDDRCTPQPGGDEGEVMVDCLFDQLTL